MTWMYERHFMLTNKYKHAEHGNIAPVLWLGITAILLYSGWNLHQDFCGIVGCDDNDGGDGVIPPIPVEAGSSWVWLLVAAVVAFAFARSR